MLTRPLAELPPPSANQWFALRVLCTSRLAVALLLMSPIGFGSLSTMFGNTDERSHFMIVAAVYLALTIGYLIAVSRYRRHYHLQLLLHGTTDVLALSLMSHFAYSLYSGLSLLLVAAVAATAVLSTPALVGFFASLATLSLLAESLYRYFDGSPAGLTLLLQSGLIGAACFVTAYLINWLATRLDRQERLAYQRGEDLRNQLAITQLVIAELQQGVMVVSEQGVLLTVNRAASIVLGGRAMVGESLLRKSRHAASALADAADQLGVALRTWQQAPVPKPESQEILLKMNGHRTDGLRIRVRFLRARAQSGDTVMVIENLRNVEERAQQLKLASMGRLSASIAHEIRNPLAAIRHANSLLAEQFDEFGESPSVERRGKSRGELLDLGPMRRMAGIIETNTVRINRIVEDVLSISRREPPALEAIDLHRFMPAFISEFVNSAPETFAQDRVVLVLGSDEPMLFDPNHLHQILVNVLSNASRYASMSAGAICIEWRRKADDRLELSVADDGPGLAPEVMQHLFEPFFTTEARGTGLGLYLARELCFANGAGIRCERRGDDSRYPGEFIIEPRRRVELPAAQSEESGTDIRRDLAASRLTPKDSAWHESPLSLPGDTSTTASFSPTESPSTASPSTASTTYSFSPHASDQPARQ